MRRSIAALSVLAVWSAAVATGQPVPAQPGSLGIALEGYEYPHPVSFLPLAVDGQDVRLAYMDVKPRGPGNGRAVVLFHGKNFFGAYWKGTIQALSEAGYRVIVPDQIGFGKSSKPEAHYSFHRMATHTMTLLDTLGVGKVAVVGHSMGGMVAVRFALTYPQLVTHLVLENPIGLEDYREEVPYASTDQLYQAELGQTEQAIRDYHRAYYAQWRPEYEEYVQVHYRWTLSGEHPRLAKAAALTSQMIYEQPVVHELPLIRARTLLVIGQKDRTALGKNRVSDAVRATLGNYPELGRAATAAIPGARLVPLEDVGHVPHFEAAARFHEEVLGFLAEKPADLPKSPFDHGP